MCCKLCKSKEEGGKGIFEGSGGGPITTIGDDEVGSLSNMVVKEPCMQRE